MSSNSLIWLRASAWAAIAGAVALFSADAALAQECADDGDCDDGYACTSAGTEPCPGSLPCKQGDEACRRMPPPACDPKEIKRCAPAPCEDDSDCPESMLCHAIENHGCMGGGATPPMTGPACMPGDPNCATPAQPQEPAPVMPADNCESKTTSQCTPRYALPCTNDDDCGNGFKCKEEISVSCAGSSGSMSGGATPNPNPSDAGAGPNPAPPPVPEDGECQSEPTGNYACELQVLPCEAAADCPADFECVDNPRRTVCDSASSKPGDDSTPPAGDPGTGARGGSGGADGGGGASGGDEPVDSCGNANDGLPEKTCLPQHYYESGGVGVHENGIGAADPTAATPPSDSTGATGTGKPKGNQAASTADAGMDGDSKNDGNSDDGCAVVAPGASHSSNAWSILGLLGLSALALRKRTRQAA